MPVTPHLALGRLGEELAAAHLHRDGMRILARNWRTSEGELDIVARHRRTTVFCEVKTRSGIGFGTPMEAIDDRKVTRIRALARRWRHQHGFGRLGSRFDVVCVIVSGDGTARLEHRRGVW